MRIRLGRGFLTSKWGLALLGGAAVSVLLCTSVFAYYYIQFSRMIDARLSGQVFQNTSRVYAAPAKIFAGQTLTAGELATALRRAGYAENESEDAVGQYKLMGSAVEIRPRAGSYFGSGLPMKVEFAGREVTKIRSLKDGAALPWAEIEPELLTNLFDTSREKRRLVRFDDLPKVLVDAVLAAEDKRFFEHPGLDPVRVLGALVADLRPGGKRLEGASTLDMQVARSFFFSTRREWGRKLSETLVALQLEQRLSKQQIFELYANEIYLGNRGSFAIHGFGEAAQAYFGKDIRQITLGEAAFLAAIIRAPNRYSNADRSPERAAEARDRVLKQMVENHQVPAEMAEAARREKLRLVSGGLETSSAPYFVDIVKDHLLEKISEADLVSQSYRVYTTLDSGLQRAAAEAVEAGMKEVDAQLARKYERWRQQAKKTGEEVPRAQVALVALDPHTGEIKALIGGRNYGQSQLNRVLARRQPGSVFKPFVYAAAFETGAEGIQPTLTPITTLNDEPTVFYFDNKEYTPNNYGEKFHGIVTLREALTYSLNNATVKLAEMVGYGNVMQMARQLGLDPKIQATPALALGAYEMTPLDVAGGYTVFANNGVKAEPFFLSRVVSAEGAVVERMEPRTHTALDPRVAYLVNSLLQDVVNKGTAATVRSRGFLAPAAGKTGTSHDGWFAGFDSNLLCVVWVGFDDNRELGLAGGSSAAIIWAEFMKRAIGQPGYNSADPFKAPDGVVTVNIDPDTLQLATPMCPVAREEVFVVGTEPSESCWRHGGHRLAQIPPFSVFSKLFGKDKTPATADAGSGEAPAHAGAASPPQKSEQRANGDAAAASKQASEEQKKKGLLGRLFGIFGSKKEKKP